MRRQTQRKIKFFQRCLRRHRHIHRAWQAALHELFKEPPDRRRTASIKKINNQARNALRSL